MAESTYRLGVAHLLRLAGHSRDRPGRALGRGDVARRSAVLAAWALAS